MMEFIVQPLRLEIRGTTYARGDRLYFYKIWRNGEWQYRLTPKKYKVSYKPEEYEWFTQKQLDAMQPHWISQQQELAI